MTAGILMGQFEPLHFGHLQDINQAVAKVDTLHIIITSSDDANPKFQANLTTKAKWLQVACQHFGFVQVHTTDSLGLGDVSASYDVDMTTLDINKAISALSDKSYDLTDGVVVFVQQGIAHCDDSAEGHQVVCLPAYHQDMAKMKAKPWAYFYDIALPARSHYTQTVCIVGGESSGKTTLVHKLANHYGASVALEMGRFYTHTDLGGTEIGLGFDDYLPIAINHAHAINHAIKHATAPITLVDTDFATTQAFCEEYEGRTHPVVASLAQTYRMDFTIYLDNNVKWVADGMRRLGDGQSRSRFATRLLEVLARYDIKPVMIDDADYHQRYLQAVDYIDDYILGRLQD